MYEEFQEPSPLLNALGRWLRPSPEGEWLPPRQARDRRVISRPALLEEFLLESAQAAQLPIRLLATYTGPLAQAPPGARRRIWLEREGDLDPETAGGSGELVPLLVASAGARYP